MTLSHGDGQARQLFILGRAAVYPLSVAVTGSLLVESRLRMKLALD